MEKLQSRKQKKCRAYISKDAQIKALKDRIKELERNIEQFEMELR
tara:strand:+ start:40 stop:174 length:135 start_codon:yes stop_codon:yes gene_type:complete